MNVKLIKKKKDPRVDYVTVVGVVVVDKLSCELCAWISRGQTKERHLVVRLELLHIIYYLACSVHKSRFLQSDLPQS